MYNYVRIEAGASVVKLFTDAGINHRFIRGRLSPGTDSQMLVYSGAGVAAGIRFDADGFIYVYEGGGFAPTAATWSYDYGDVLLDVDWAAGSCSIFYDGAVVDTTSFASSPAGLGQIIFQAAQDDYLILDKMSVTDEQGNNHAIISSPCACREDLIRGKVSVVGSAWCENFGKYQILVCPADLNPNEPYNWTVADSGTEVVTNSILGYWDTSAIPNGYYFLAIAIFDDHLSCPEGVQIVTADYEGQQLFKRFSVVGDFKSNSFVHQEKPDIQVAWPGGAEFELTRVYNSARRFYTKPFANGFSHSYHVTLTEDARFYYTIEPGGVFEVPSWDGSLLGFGDVWVTWADGRAQLFRRAGGYMSSATASYKPWPNSDTGQTLERTSFDDGGGQISRIEYVVKDRDGTEQFFCVENPSIEAAGPFGEIGFCVNANLAAVKDRFGNEIDFTWDSQKKAITRMTCPSATIELDLDEDGFYTQARLVSEGQTRLRVDYVWDDQASIYKVIKRGRGVDANGVYDAARVMEQVVQYQYDPNALVRRISYDEDISKASIEIDYDEFSRVKARRDFVDAGLWLETKYSYEFFRPAGAGGAWWLKTTETTPYKDEITIQNENGAAVEAKIITADGCSAIDSNCIFADARNPLKPTDITEKFDGFKRRTKVVYNEFGDAVEKRVYVNATDYIDELFAYHPDYSDQICKTGFTELSGRGERVQTRYVYGDASGQADEYGKYMIGQKDLISGAAGEPNAIWASTKFEYLANGLVSKKIDPNNFVTIYEYDALGNKVFEKVLQGSESQPVKRYYYDGLGRLCLEASAGGLVTRYWLDDFGNCYKTALYEDPQCMGKSNGEFVPSAYDGAAQLGFTLAGFDSRSNKTFERLLSSGTVRTSYTRGNAPMVKLYDDGGRIEYSYDQRGLKIQERRVNRDANDFVIKYAYNSMSRLIKTDHYDYDDMTLLKSVRQSYTASGSATSRQVSGDMMGDNESLDKYDILGRRIENIVAPGSVALATLYGYDASGNCVCEIDPNRSITRYDYDLAGHKIAEYFSQTDANLAGQVKTKYEYYANGLEKTVTSYDHDGSVLAKKQLEYDGRRRVIRITQQIDMARYAVTSYEYFDTGFYHDGEIYNIRITDAAGKDTFIRTDAMGNWIKILYPSGAVKVANYNVDGTIGSRALFDNENNLRWISYQYDGCGNCIRTDYPDGGYVLHEYDSFARKTRTRDLRTESENIGGSSRIEYSYDPLDRLIEARDQQGFVTSYSYAADDKPGNIRIFGPGGSEPIYEIMYEYDEACRLVNIFMPNTFSMPASFIYDKNSRVKQTRFNLSNSLFGGEVMDVNYSYNRDDNLTNVSVSPSSVNFAVAYSYDGLNRLHASNQTCAGGAVNKSYGYDMLSRLTNETGDEDISYTWDNAGNLLAKSGLEPRTYSYNGDQLVADSNGRAVEWDENLCARSSFVSASQVDQFAIDYTWEGFIKNCWQNGTSEISRYSPDGPRVSRGNNYYIYDAHSSPARVVMILGDSQTISKSYIWANDRLIVQYNGSTLSSPLFVLTDRLCSVRALVNSDAEIVSACNYDSWGNVVGAPGQIDCDIRFAGYFYDSDIGKYYCQARYYDPQMFGFTTADSLKPDLLEPASFHPVLYCFDDPLNRTDPLGLFGGIISSADIRAREAKRSVGALNWARRYITEINQRHFANTLKVMRENMGSYTRSNYRSKLLAKIGTKAKGEVHHIVPQEFRAIANKALKEYGLSIDHPWFTRLMDEGAHIAIHRAGYNVAWRGFFANSPSALEIISNAIDMAGL